MTEELPSGWTEVALEDVCTSASQRGPEADAQSFRYIDLGAIDNRTKQVANANSLLTADAPSRAKQVVAEGDVLFSTVRVYLENIAQVPAELNGAIASTAFTVLRPGAAVEPRYLYRIVSSRRFIQAVNALQRGNSPPSVQDGDVRGQRVPLPPLREQRRIVSRIDELFSEIDEGERALERVQKLVERYRQSVLKAAVSGELTREWRARHKRLKDPLHDPLLRVLDGRRTAWAHALQTGGVRHGQYPEPSEPKYGAEGEAPPGWALVSIEAATRAERPIAYGVLQPGADVEQGIPLVRVCDVADGTVDQRALKRVAPEIVAQFPRTRLQGGEVLLTIVGTIGRTGIVTNDLAGANVARAVAVLAPQPAVHAEWLELCLREERTRQLLTGTAREVARKTLNLEQLRECAILVPPPDEQEVAISIVRCMLSQANAVAADVARQARESSSLKQATLKAAFSGQLAPQDPSDEPASALLARLAAQPSEEPNGTRRRGRPMRTTTA